jgi:ubiquinone/menaquinone biosynthesis C-methylase UbiE
MVPNKNIVSEKAFYDVYFNKSTYEMFKYDVGSLATRQAILNKINTHHGAVLELGIGIASLLEDLQHLACTGIDISEKTISMTTQFFKNNNLAGTFLQADAINLPFPNASFDLVVSSHVFEHIENDATAFQEVSRVLKPNGMFIMFVPGSLDGKASTEEWEKCRHYRNYNTAEIFRLQRSSNNQLIVQSISFEHKIHNLIWNKAKHLVRYINYPIKKWLLRDGKDIESRKTYQQFFLPAFTKTLNSLDSLTNKTESFLLGAKFNVLAVFKKQ